MGTAFNKPTVRQVKEKSIKERYYPYDTWLERFFSSWSPYIAWIFIRLNISANAVSWISAMVAVLGAVLLASNDNRIVFAGSFGYIIYYQLDYVDGSVARFNNKVSIGGQYVDFIMHVISHVAVMGGLCIGAIRSSGEGIYPIAILALVASALCYARHSVAWFAIVMEQQKRRARGEDVLQEKPFVREYREPNFIYEVIRKITVLIFHEQYLIFILPVLAFLQLVAIDFVDFRFVLVIFAGFVYFPVCIYEIKRLVDRNGIDEAYWKLFSEDTMPDIPDDHFFRSRES